MLQDLSAQGDNPILSTVASSLLEGDVDMGAVANLRSSIQFQDCVARAHPLVQACLDSQDADSREQTAIQLITLLGRMVQLVRACPEVLQVGRNQVLFDHVKNAAMAVMHDVGPIDGDPGDSDNASAAEMP